MDAMHDTPGRGVAAAAFAACPITARTAASGRLTVVTTAARSIAARSTYSGSISASRTSVGWIAARRFTAGRITGCLLAAASSAFAPTGVQAQPRDGFGGGSEALAPARLDALRGGFVLPSGLVMSFGIERTVSVNGVVVASTRLSVPDLANLTGAQARELASLRDTMHVQVGEGNALRTTSAAGGPLLPATIVQNTLDAQTIDVATTIDASVGSLGLFQQINAGAALQSALIGAAGGP